MRNRYEIAKDELLIDDSKLPDTSKLDMRISLMCEILLDVRDLLIDLNNKRL